MSYGFIITRHVNSEKTNKYWNQCIKLIRTHYPLKQIIVIDDNSNQNFIKADFDYQNITIIQSEYPGRGELLPFIYFLKHKWFDNAVILHDSVFIHNRIPFESITVPVLPLWHHGYDKEHKTNLSRIASCLTNNSKIKYNINGGDNNLSLLGPIKTGPIQILCFGCQCYINLVFLEKIQKKYTITNLINVVTCRKDRCGLERIMGLLFCQEFPDLKKTVSLFGDIFKHYQSFSYNYDEYIEDFNKKKVPHKFVKVWTGR
jgi:hypothetical protein